jgi:undecaprenyl-diphosphatase
VAGWAVGFVVRAISPGFDLEAVRELAADRTGTLTSISRALSLIGSGYVVFALAVVSAAVLYGRRAYDAAIAVLLSTIGGVFVSNVDKLLVGRPRPPVHRLQHVTSFGFPSGHATQSTALYVALVLVVLGWGPRSRAAQLAAGLVAALLVIAISFSRVYLGVHYPTDVAAGILLGGGWALLVSTRRRTRSGLGRGGPA